MVFGGSSKKKKYFGINLPIFAILGYRDKVYFAGGGGGKKYGVKNMLVRIGERGCITLIC